MIEDIRQQQIEAILQKEKKAKQRRKKWILIAVPLLLLLILVSLLLVQILANRHFETTYYQLQSEKITEPIKLAVLSDLHSVEYGPGNSDLIEAIQAEQPDLICMIGDMVNNNDQVFSPFYRLCEALQKIAPVYFTLGNHEGTLMYNQLDTVPLDTELTERGVHVLINRNVAYQKGDTTLQIAGIATNSEEYDRWAREKLEDYWNLDGYKLVLSHFPELYDTVLNDADFDLALAGHYHGGQICIPGVGGLYHPESGLFPKYWGGQYPMENGTLIVSRGIGGHGWIPRINNRPELVIIEITPEVQEE